LIEPDNRNRSKIMNQWEWIFRQSKVNDGLYDGDRLATQNWDWPSQTWFQERLEHFRAANAKQSTSTSRIAPAPARDRREAAPDLRN
jgi:hypothetical protein